MAVPAAPDPAIRLIAQNQTRFAKELADDVTRALQEYLTAGGSPAEAAVLYRTGMIAFPLISRLEKAEIPFRILGGRPNPFARWMARDILGYIRWAWRPGRRPTPPRMKMSASPASRWPVCTGRRGWSGSGSGCYLPWRAPSPTDAAWRPAAQRPWRRSGASFMWG